MKNQRTSLDGLIPRSPNNSRVGHFHRQAAPKVANRPVDRSIHTGAKANAKQVKNAQVGALRPGREMGARNHRQAKREDIFETLEELDNLDEPAVSKKSRKHAKKRNRKKIVKWFFIVLLVAILAVGGYVVIKSVIAGSSIFGGNLFDAITKTEPLKEDENGRSNFLIFGTAEDSEGGNHGGANLTDSIMILSVNQTKKDAYMLSLPRDLWVEYDETCSVGYQGKLNATYFCGSGDGEDETAGAEALRKKVGAVTGLDIQYHVHLNFTAVVQAVDAVGGVDVTIESDDPRGVLDRNFDWACNYTCYYVNYKNGETVHLDGQHALALARARNASGGYGIGDNFGREQNQQKILKALRDKALSAGTLSNLGAVTGLIDALGSNLRTNVDAKEVRTLMELASEVDSSNIVSLTLNDPDNLLVVTGNQGGQSIVRPVAGLFNYSEIISYVKSSMTSDPFIKEESHVSVFNGSGISGAARSSADSLSDEGFTIDTVGDAPNDNYDATVVYQISSDKPASAAKLESLYGVKVRTSSPPVSVVGETDFVVIIGKTEATRQSR